jgi:hypothetical protein
VNGVIPGGLQMDSPPPPLTGVQKTAGVSPHLKGLSDGAGERIRTADLPFTRRLLCQLSYTGGRLRAC